MKTYWRAVGENLGLALDTLRTHKFRSFLTVLGVLIGTTTVIAVASIIRASTPSWCRWPSNMAPMCFGFTSFRWARRTA